MKEVATKEMWSRLKEMFKRRIFMSRHHSDVVTPMEYNSGHDITLMSRRGFVNETTREALQVNEVATSF